MREKRKLPAVNLLLLRDLTNIPLAKLNAAFDELYWHGNMDKGSFISQNLTEEGRKRVLKECIRVRTFAGAKYPSDYKLTEHVLFMIFQLLANDEPFCMPSRLQKAVVAGLLCHFKESMKGDFMRKENRR